MSGICLSFLQQMVFLLVIHFKPEFPSADLLHHPPGFVWFTNPAERQSLAFFSLLSYILLFQTISPIYQHCCNSNPVLSDIYCPAGIFYELNIYVLHPVLKIRQKNCIVFSIISVNIHSIHPSNLIRN